MLIKVKRDIMPIINNEESLENTKKSLELWELEIGELAGHNIETAGRDEVNKMLAEGWILLHIYTLKYKEDGAWRERPMAILGKPKP
jgi:hypothetical protein